MKDRFEDFIKDNADSFDFLEPKADLWDGVEKNLDRKQRFNWSRIATRTAAVAAIFIVSFVIQKFIFSDNFNLPSQEAKIEIPELQEAEMYYNNVINTKLNNVQPLLQEHPYLQEELNTDLNALENIYDELKNDLKDDIANQEVLEEMIQNYRLRIQILEEMAGFINENNEEQETKNNQYEL